MDLQDAHRFVATSMLVTFVTIALAQDWLRIVRDAVTTRTH